MIKRFFLYRLSFCGLLFFLVGGISAQTNFLYIQSENNQPYFIQWKGNTYGSSGKGYLFIPQLPNGKQDISLSFPGNQYREYIFSFTVADKPKGFALRITQDGEWILMDMVTRELLRGVLSGLPVNTNTPKQIQKINERTNDIGLDQKYLVKNGSKTDTVTVFIPSIIASNPVNNETRVAEKAGSGKPISGKPATKIKVPLVPEAFGSNTPKKSVKQ
ncbi:MAG: hypothetical protein ACRCSM_13970 [Sediminibacterium sp.]|jgi:hypothetical protein|nr:hypothetical protein [Chitinophagaceae bacterium]MCA6445653.1 hypothetical protein [Chitinophagaceae bacterium]